MRVPLMTMLLAMTATTALAQETGQAPHGPLYRVPGEDIFNWMTAPERMPDGRIRVWHWTLTHGMREADPPANGYPFLDEYDCAAGTSARIRREWWQDHQLVRVYRDRSPHRIPADGFMPARLLRVVCDGEPLGEPVADTDDARALIPRD